MLKGILSISGKPGLYKLVNQGKQMLIVESLETGRRGPAYAHDKVISLADVAIYTPTEDVPLAKVLENLKAKADGKPVDLKAFKDEAAIREFFGEVLPDFDRERVYTTDIKKLIGWYNKLLAAGIDKFVEEEAAEETEGSKESPADSPEAKA